MVLPAGLRLAVEDAPSEADIELLPHRLEDFNESRWPGHQPWQPLGVFVRDGEAIAAGLAGETYAGWLFVRYLWVAEHLRGQASGANCWPPARHVPGRAAATRSGSTLQLPGTWLLSKARLPGVRRTRLVPRTQAPVPVQEALIRSLGGWISAVPRGKPARSFVPGALHAAADPRPRHHPPRGARGPALRLRALGQRLPPALRRHPRARAADRRRRAGRARHAAAARLRPLHHRGGGAHLRPARPQAADPGHRLLRRPHDPPGARGRPRAGACCRYRRWRPTDPEAVAAALEADPEISHVGLVYSETGSGIIHDVRGDRRRGAARWGGGCWSMRCRRSARCRSTCRRSRRSTASASPPTSAWRPCRAWRSPWRASTAWRRAPAMPEAGRSICPSIYAHALRSGWGSFRFTPPAQVLNAFNVALDFYRRRGWPAGAAGALHRQHAHVL